MTLDANKTTVEAGISAIYQSGYRKGYQEGVKSARTPHGTLLFLSLMMLFLFGSGVLGAIIYGVAARVGRITGIIGACS